MTGAPLMLVFDTETTGLTLHPDADQRKQPKIIEFGGALLDMRTGEVVDTYSQVIDPGEAVTEEITKITGITNAMFDGMPTLLGYSDTLLEAFSRAAAVAAHNLPFDKAMIMNDLRRIGRVHELPWPRSELCTVGVFKERWGRNPRLIELYEAVIGKPFEQKHRALDDVMHLVEIIQQERLWELV